MRAAFLAAALAIGASAFAAPEGPERVPLSDQLAAQANAVSNTAGGMGTATAPATPAPVSTPWIQPPPHSRYPPMLTPGMVGGLALLILGFSFFWAEAHATTHGAFAVAGVLSCIAGVAMIFGYTTLAISISWSVVGPLTIASLGLVVWTVYKGFQHMGDPGLGEMSEHVGKIVKASGPLTPAGKIFLEGSFWNARSTANVKDGANVRIVGADGLTFLVEPVA